LVRATFQLTAHGYLLPKDVAMEVTTKRVVSPNTIQFIDQAVDASFFDENLEGFKSINEDPDELASERERRLKNLIDKSQNLSAGVYPQEFD